MCRRGHALATAIGQIIGNTIERALSPQATVAPETARAYNRRSASAGTIRIARHAGKSEPRTQSAKAATMIGAIRPMLGLKEMRLPMAGMKGKPNPARKPNSTPRTQPITHMSIPSITIDIMIRASLHPMAANMPISRVRS
jgi:hypothetical protein